MNLSTLTQYELLQEKYLKDLKTEGYLLRHKKTGARVLLMDNNDDNKNTIFEKVGQTIKKVFKILFYVTLCIGIMKILLGIYNTLNLFGCIRNRHFVDEKSHLNLNPFVIGRIVNIVAN